MHAWIFIMIPSKRGFESGHKPLKLNALCKHTARIEAIGAWGSVVRPFRLSMVDQGAEFASCERALRERDRKEGLTLRGLMTGSSGLAGMGIVVSLAALRSWPRGEPMPSQLDLIPRLSQWDMPTKF
jgi:hypothetical protein